jgi:hypothetical protein
MGKLPAELCNFPQLNGEFNSKERNRVGAENCTGSEWHVPVAYCNGGLWLMVYYKTAGILNVYKYKPHTYNISMSNIDIHTLFSLADSYVWNNIAFWCIRAVF